MKFKTIWMVCCLLLTSASLFAQDENSIREYIERYKALAMAEQIRAGVPAAITLAQGIHESTAGKSELATKGNNHFGIKCKSTWMGETILHDDDKKQECFRKYVSAEQSYIDHSDFLKGSNRYHFLFDLDRTDYVGWASGLKRAGYATNPLYVKKLTDLVEKFNLQQYTYDAISKSSKVVAEVIPENDQPKNLTHVDDPSTFYKGIRGFWAGKGETLLPKALEKNIRYAKLLSLNDLADEPLQTDMFIFIEKKRKVGTEEFHVVKENESMLLIAQKEAMLLSSLYTFNNLVPGQEPETGERLALQYKSYETPKIKQRFLKELETNQSGQTVISSVEKKSSAESVPALANLPKEKPVTEPKKIIIPVEEPKQSNQEVAAQAVKAEAVEPKQTPVVEKVQEIVVAEKQPEPVKTEVVIKESIPEPETQPAPEVKNTPVVAEKNIPDEVVNKKDIINAEKANRMDQLLNSKPLDKPSEPVIIPEPKNTTLSPTSPFSDRNPAAEIKQEPAQEKKEEPAPVEVVVAPPPPVVKRTYDEPDVNDSVKALKRKFDDIVYSPRPPRRIDTSKKVVPVIQKPVVVPKAEDKKSNVQVTNTGIKRDLSKPSANKEKETKKADSKKKAAENAKKGGSKKTTPAAKKAATGKKASTKKAASPSTKPGAKKQTKKR